MPKLAIDYSKTIMYKFLCNDLTVTDNYVGNTTHWVNRKNIHKQGCTNPNNIAYNRKIYTIMREHGGWNNWQMIEIEKYPCNDSNEATARERYWYDELKSTMNFMKPQLTDDERTNYNVLCRSGQKKEYYIANKAHIDEAHKQYYIANKAHIAERKKSNVFICSCGSTARVNDRKHHLNSASHVIAMNIIDV